MKRLLLLLLFPLLASAQPARPAYWLRAYLRTQLSPRLTLHSEADERRFARPDQQWQLITHQHLHYRFSPAWDAALGATYSWQASSRGTTPERRVFQEATATLALGSRLRLQPRLRTEQRWQWAGAGPDSAPTWRFRLRSRTRLQLDYRLASAWKLRASNELMLHATTFDQNRLYVGAERQLGAGFAAELGYLHIWQTAASADAYLERRVLRLTIFKDLALVAAR